MKKTRKFMSKRNLTVLMACLSLPAFLLTSCNSDKKKIDLENENVKTVAVNYLKAAMLFDFSEAKKYVAKDKSASYEKDRDAVTLSGTQGETFNLILLESIISNNSSNYQVVNVEIADDKLTAKATVHIIPINRSTLKDRIISLIKEDGNWKVDERIEDVMIQGSVDYSLQTGFTITEK
jgi:hypothetical protein